MIGAILADLRPVVRGADRALTLPLSPGWFPVGARVASKSSNSASEGHIVHAIQVRLSFVFDVPFFVFNDMVASIVIFSNYFRFRAGAGAGTFPPDLAPGRWPAPAYHNVSTK